MSPARRPGDDDRSRRSALGGAVWLFVPGAEERFVRRALAAPPDVIVLDLEDGLDQTDLASARRRIRELAGTRPANATFVLRTHAADHPAFAGDVADAWGPHMSGLVLPKAASPAEVVHAERTIVEHELAAGSPSRAWSIVPTVESSRGLDRLGGILQASARVQAVALGSEDLAFDLGLPPPLPSDPEGCAARAVVLDALRARVVVAAAACGIHVRLDAPPLRWDDDDALSREARRARAMGFTGRLLIHPAQMAPTRRGFAPSPAEVRWARTVLEEAEGRRSTGADGGAWRFEATMVDEAVLRQARAVLTSEEA